MRETPLPLIYASFTDRGVAVGLRTMRDDYNVFYAQHSRNVNDVLQKLYRKKGNSGELRDPHRLKIDADDLQYLKKELTYSTKISTQEAASVLQLVKVGMVRIQQGYDVWMTRMTQ